MRWITVTQVRGYMHPGDPDAETKRNREPRWIGQPDLEVDVNCAHLMTMFDATELGIPDVRARIVLSTGADLMVTQSVEQLRSMLAAMDSLEYLDRQMAPRDET